MYKNAGIYLNRTRQKIVCYTLIELLVTITVITILTTMLISAMKLAVKKEKQLSCKNNLSEIGVAMQLYIGDNLGKLPYATWSNFDASSDRLGWDDLIYNYLSSRSMSEEYQRKRLWEPEYGLELMKCPASTTPYINDYHNAATITYTMPMSEYFNNQPPLPATIGQWRRDGSNKPPNVHHIARLANPSQIIHLSELESTGGGNQLQGSGHSMYNAFFQSAPDSDGIRQRGNITNYTLDLHPESMVNYLFVDGRVKVHNTDDPELLGEGTMSDPGGMWTVDPND